MRSDSFKNVTYKLFIYKSFELYIYIYIYKQDLTLNNLQGLILYQTQSTNFKNHIHLIYICINRTWLELK